MANDLLNGPQQSAQTTQADAPDTRVWMYRKGEGKIFPSPDAVPKKEGWQDTPAPTPEPETPPTEGA